MCGLLLGWSAPLTAATTAEPSAPPVVDTPTEGENEFVNTIDRTHERISRTVVGPARWLDAFFADERVEEEASDTRLRFRLSTLTTEEDALQVKVRPRLHLDLPLLSERLHLLVTGDSDDADLSTTHLGEFRHSPAERTEERSSLSLRYFLSAKARRNISLRAGVRLSSGVPYLFFEPRYRQTFRLEEPWILRLTQRFIAESDGDLEARTRLDLERPLSPSLFFRTTAQGSWYNDEPGYFYYLNLTLYQPLSRNRVLQYGWSNALATRPTHVLEEIQLRITYRQRLWRDWLYGEVAPFLSFPREHDYRITPGLFLQLELIFGEFPPLRKPAPTSSRILRDRSPPPGGA
ncbi:MAG: hypothetical protein IH614_06570 [Desulfuromonadales bacterium]|nr:hypothetical protein [Desulfuromonadales bacterium]